MLKGDRLARRSDANAVGLEGGVEFIRVLTSRSCIFCIVEAQPAAVKAFLDVSMKSALYYGCSNLKKEKSTVFIAH